MLEIEDVAAVPAKRAPSNETGRAARRAGAGASRPAHKPETIRADESIFPSSSPGMSVAVARIEPPFGEQDGSYQLRDGSALRLSALHEPSVKSSSDLCALT